MTMTIAALLSYLALFLTAAAPGLLYLLWKRVRRRVSREDKGFPYSRGRSR